MRLLSKYLTASYVSLPPLQARPPTLLAFSQYLLMVMMVIFFVGLPQQWRGFLLSLGPIIDFNLQICVSLLKITEEIMFEENKQLSEVVVKY